MVFSNTTIALSTIISTANHTGYADFMGAVNTNVFGGVMVFVLLCALALMIYIGLLYEEGFVDPVPNFVGVCFVFSIISFIARILGYMTDNQTWVFPILTAIGLFLMYATKNTS